MKIITIAHLNIIMWPLRKREIMSVSPSNAINKIQKANILLK